MNVPKTRDYDVVLYGAGGFTGRQTVAYFAKHAPAGLRWAIAGPRLHTLEAARRDAGAPLGAGDVFVATAATSVRSMRSSVAHECC